VPARNGAVRREQASGGERSVRLVEEIANGRSYLVRRCFLNEVAGGHGLAADVGCVLHGPRIAEAAEVVLQHRGLDAVAFAEKLAGQGTEPVAGIGADPFTAQLMMMPSTSTRWYSKPGSGMGRPSYSQITTQIDPGR
jgi:hypothetical protein